jgi:hypothetical protein
VHTGNLTGGNRENGEFHFFLCFLRLLLFNFGLEGPTVQWKGPTVGVNALTVREKVPTMRTDGPLVRWNDSAVRSKPATMRTIVRSGKVMSRGER